MFVRLLISKQLPAIGRVQGSEVGFYEAHRIVDSVYHTCMHVEKVSISTKITISNETAFVSTVPCGRYCLCCAAVLTASI